MPRSFFRRAAYDRPLLIFALLLSTLASLIALPVHVFADGSLKQTLTIADVSQLAEQSDPAITSARTAISASQARVAQVGAQRKLQLSFNSIDSLSNGSVFQPPPTQETFGTTANSLLIPLPNNAKLNAQQQAASADLVTTQAQFEVAQRTTIAEVQNAFFELLRDQAILAASQQTLAQAQSDEDAATKRFQDGAGAQIDITRTQVPVLNAQADVASNQTKVDAAREALNNLIGRPADAPLTIVEPAFSGATTTLPSPDMVQRAASSLSLNARIAHAQQNSAKAAIDQARTARAPSFGLSVSDTRSKDLTGFSRLDVAQISVTIPLSDGGLATQQAAEANANLQSAQANYVKAQREAAAEALQAFETARGALARLTPIGDSVRIAQVSVDKTRQGYDAGLYTIRDVLDAEAALAQARLANIQATYDAEAAEYALARTLGKDQP